MVSCMIADKNSRVTIFTYNFIIKFTILIWIKIILANLNFISFLLAYIRDRLSMRFPLTKHHRTYTVNPSRQQSIY